MVEVSIVQRRLTDYRVPLFVALQQKLSANGVRLRVLHGDGTAREVHKGDAGRLAWAEKLDTTYALSDRVCWQPFASRVRSSDLVIVTQENKLVNNLTALFLPRRYRLAFWGHGANLQSAAPKGLRERFKRVTTNRVDWWFAYTGMSVRMVADQGFPAERITNLENAIDTKALADLCASVTSSSIESVREAVGAVPGRMALFLGSLYPEKRLDFLLQAARSLSGLLPGFKLVVVGDGPQRSLVERAAASEPWLHYAGRRTGLEKATYLRAADVILNPGLVGLGILDAFVAGTPMLTTDCGLHSPEIDYLRNNFNGVMTSDDLGVFVHATAETLQDMNKLASLRAGCEESAAHFTIDNMAENFCRGILEAVR